MLTFRVPGNPRPKPRAKVTKRGNFLPAAYLEWRDAVADEAAVACLAAQNDGRPWRVDAEAYALRCVFHMPDRRCKDLDNATGGVMDALTRAGLWPDDHLVDSLTASKVFGSGWSGVVVTVVALPDGWRSRQVDDVWAALEQRREAA